MKKTPAALLSNIQILQQGIDLLKDISDELYTQNNGPYNKSGIGRHFRHIIEHYYSLIDSDYQGEINYDNRARNLRLENEREFMISALKEVKQTLNRLENEPELSFNRVMIISNEGIEDEDEQASESSIFRELQFLVSHTVHHYALIGLVLKTLGYQPNVEFGVAPSTLKYEMQKSSVDKAS